MKKRILRWGWVVVVLCVLGVSTGAQGDYGHPWVVFVRHDIDSAGRNELIFLNQLTGEKSTITGHGERYTVYARRVLFFDPVRRLVMLAGPDGSLQQHPFIQLPQNANRVEWVVSDDGSHVAWTITTEAHNQLTTETWVAAIDGADRQLVYSESNATERGMRIFPMTFSTDLQTLYLDNAYLHGISQFITFAQYVNVVALDLASGETALMPGERGNCICGADLGAGLFVRSRLTQDLSGFDLYVYDMESHGEYIIPAVNLINYDTVGDVLISPDGVHAVYALAQVSNFGAPQQTVRTVFILADLAARTQAPLTNPLTTFVRPVAWTEGSTAIIFTSPLQDGTWKIDLSDGRLDRIAEATYIGLLPAASTLVGR